MFWQGFEKRALVKNWARWVEKNPARNLAITTGLATGGLTAGIQQIPGLKNKQREQLEDQIKRKYPKLKGKKLKEKVDKALLKLRVLSPIVSGAAGAFQGYMGGSQLKQQQEFWNDFGRQSNRWRSATRMTPIRDLWGKLDLTGNETMKSEVRKKYYDMAKKFHPDLGVGSEDQMKKINNAWTEIQETPWFQKLAFWAGFSKCSSDGSLQDYFADVGADARDKKEPTGNFYDENRNWRDAIQYAPSHDQINESKGPR